MGEIVITQGQFESPPDWTEWQNTVGKNARNREYLVNDEWTTKSHLRIQDTVFVTDEENLDLYEAYVSLKKMHVDRAVSIEKSKERMKRARMTGKTLPLFVPWGVRDAGEPQAEVPAMNRLSRLQFMLQKWQIPAEVMIMPADVYAKDINQINPQRVDDYFCYIAQLAAERGFTVQPWSVIRSRNLDEYNRQLQKWNDNRTRLWLPDSIIESAIESARRRSNGSDKHDDAYRYLAERVCEAKIIEQIYSPIKVSLAPPKKDDYIDCELPRLYLFPEEEKLPWLKQ